MDLARALTDAAHQATADREPPAADALLPRIHRRRALRRGGDALAGVAAAGLVALALVTLGSGRAAPPPPAGPTFTGGVWPAEATACGAAVAPDDGTGPVELVAALDGRVAEVLAVRARIAARGDVALPPLADGPATLLVLAEGRVAATAHVSFHSGDTEALNATDTTGPLLDLAVCGEAGSDGSGLLPDGSYQVALVATLGRGLAATTMIGVATDLDVTGGVATSPAWDDGTLPWGGSSAPAGTRPWPAAVTVPAVPACGDAPPAVDAPADAVLRASVTVPAGAQASNLVRGVTLAVEGPAGAYLTTGGTTFALVRDGRVVALTGENAVTARGGLLDLAPTLCDGPGSFVPAGDYELYVYVALSPEPVGDALPYPGLLVLADGPHPITLSGASAAFDTSPTVDGPVLRYPAAPTGTAEGMAAILSGTLELDGSCLWLVDEASGSREPVVWPAGTTWDDERQVVVAPSGEVMPIGTAVRGSGGSIDVANVTRLLDADAGALAESCLGSSRDVAFANNWPDAMAPQP